MMQGPKLNKMLLLQKETIPKDANWLKPVSDYPTLPMMFDVLVFRVLNAKGVVTADELRASVEAIDSWGAKAEGPTIVARAWVDPVFKEKLLRDSVEALGELKFPTSNYG